MAHPEEVLWTLVRQWISKAEVDYRTAERLFQDSDPIRESIAFHCQQAAEKYLKAYLVWKQVEFPKTHNIGQLLDLLMAVSPELAIALEKAEFLTPFGVELRYPGDLPGHLARARGSGSFVGRIGPLLAGLVREKIRAELDHVIR